MLIWCSIWSCTYLFLNSPIIFTFQKWYINSSLIRDYQFKNDKGPLSFFSWNSLLFHGSLSNSLKIGTKSLAISMLGMSIKSSIFLLENGSIIWEKATEMIPYKTLDWNCITSKSHLFLSDKKLEPIMNPFNLQ